MLIAVCFAPLLAGLVFRFGVPFLEAQLCAYFQTDAIIAPYYLLLDLFLCLMTPYIVCFVSALVMLTEYDENMAAYLAVTPVGKRGYMLSRLAFPAVLSFAASLAVMALFALTRWQLHLLITASLLSSILSVAVAMLLFTLSHNRVEGMALGKLSGLFLLGLPVPFFLHSGVQFLFAPLPSFWVAKLLIDADFVYLLPALLSVLVWLWFLYRKFERKLA